MNGLKFKNNKEVSEKYKLEIYNRPKKVYIPLVEEDITILVKKDDYVLKGSIIGKTKGKYKKYIFSSISGKVIDFEEHIIFNGEKVKCVVIENDFKEQVEKGFNKIDDLNKNNFIKILENCGIVELDETCTPVYLKYDIDKKINTLIVDGISNGFIIKEKCEEILEVIDAIVEINNIDKAIIVIKKDDKKLLNIINEYIGTYLKIKVIVLSNSTLSEKQLIKKITGINYDKLPIEKGIIINNISTVYAIYETLKFNKPMIEKYITISFNNTLKNILVKLGTSVKEMLSYLELEDENKNIFINNKIVSKEILEDLIITLELNNIKITSYNKM